MVRAIDLFAGAGGLTLGFKTAGITTVCAVEIDPYSAETFARHMPDAALFVADIREVDLSSYSGIVDLVYGGPPCQPFSSGGRRGAARDERDMIPWFVKTVKDVAPAAFFMENVPGLAAGERAAYLGHVIAEFQSLGYSVAHKVINAADFGVPQKRRRLFIVGTRGRTFRFPKETHGPGRAHPYVAVGDVLPPYRLGEPNLGAVVYAKRPDPRPNPYDGHLFNGGGRPIDRGRPGHTILASAGGNKTHFFDELNLVPEYHRHITQGGAPRTGILRGARRLTVLESAIIQTFPPDIEFSGPRSAQYQQVGNAVPPQLAAVLGRSLIQQMLAADDTLDHEVHPAQPVLL